MTKNELKRIVVELLGIDMDDLSDDTLLVDIGLDSISLIQLIVEVEEKYNIEIYDSDLNIENFRTLNVMHKTLQKYFCDSTDEEQNIPLIKCVITDCDGVLWRGIAGETGIDTACIDSISVDYGKILADFKKRGGLLTMISKNERKNLIYMLERDDVPLNVDDFVIHKTDCENKEKSVVEILSQTGFLEDNVLYIDDSGFELTIIKENYPNLHCLLADGTEEFTAVLRQYLVNGIDYGDVDRTKQFREQMQREAVHIHARSAEAYNQILKTVTECRKAIEADIDRIAELSQRTNRFNTSGSRYTVDEVRKLMDRGEVYVLSAADKFGDMGLVAAVVIHRNVIENFMLSCRVFGRNFETLLLGTVIANHTEKLFGIWNDTGKNGYCKDFFANNGIQTQAVDKEETWTGKI